MMRKKQQGMTLAGWLIVILFFGCFLTGFFKLLPIYMQDYEIKAAFNKVINSAETKDQAPEQIRDVFSKYLTVNSINSISPDKLIIQEKDNKRSISLHYEVRKHLVANIDLVVFFDYQESI